MKELTADTIAEETKEGLVLVDFWAEWCGPCKMIAPVLAELEQELPEITFAKFDTEDSKPPRELNVTSIPALILYKDGDVISHKVGALPKPVLKAWLTEFLEGSV